MEGDWCFTVSLQYRDNRVVLGPPQVRLLRSFLQIEEILGGDVMEPAPIIVVS